MKKTIFFVLIMASVLVSCNQKNSENTTNTIEKLENDSIAATDSIKVYDNSQMLSCAMHPEVQGKLNDTCSKCGMKLTEPIEK